MHNITQQTIPIRLSSIQQKIAAVVKLHKRSAAEVQLLAVSKTQSPSRMLEAYHAGQRAFGENYLQEARDKQEVLKELDIEWHFIGPIQSNKTREIAEHFQWVHSVDRLKIAKRLSQQRPVQLPPLNICLQVNIDDEPTKAGVSLAELPPLMNSINALPQIHLRGLMAIPAKRDSIRQQQAVFSKIANALKHLTLSNPSLTLDTLSMGMSADMEAAIAAGATIVRVGSAIFGPRQ
ncbi:MAG: pyridoxal phosphate enzyme (YggS family) [Kiritimatiellia bacterium]|jgi:pyridoxal phosphate enzyme (YggS family)